VRIGAGKAPWHYISVDGVGSGVRELAHGGRQGDAGGAQGETGGGARRRAQEKMLAVLFDLGLGQRVEVGENRWREILWGGG